MLMIVAQFLKIYNLKATKTMLLKKIIGPKLVYKIKKTKLQIINSNLTYIFLVLIISNFHFNSLINSCF